MTVHTDPCGSGSRFLTTAEVAEKYRISPSTVRRRANKLGAFRLPGCRPLLFDEAELEKRRNSVANEEED